MMLSRLYRKKSGIPRRIKYLVTYVRKYSNTHTKHIPCLTSCEQLWNILESPAWFEKFRVLDATWDLGDKDYFANHIEQRIPGSNFFNFEECRDKTSEIPRMLPTPDTFSKCVSNLGISNEHHVIVYDNDETHAVYSSPRLWWMFRVFGHDQVSVLEGGLTSWIKEGYPVVSEDYGETEILPIPQKRFVANKRSWLVKDLDFMRTNAQSGGNFQVADARGRKRFIGLQEDGTISTGGGHIPHSSSMPYVNFSDKETRKLKSPSELKKVFSDSGVDLNGDVVASCGSGMTACIIALSAYNTGKKDVSVYDGSWSEWKVRSQDLISRGDEK